MMKNDIAYENGQFIPDAASYVEHWQTQARNHRELEATLGRARLNAPYGPGPREKLDMFHPNGPAEGLVVFVHGGYWLKFDRSYWSHLAAGLTARGWAVAMPSYPLTPEVRIHAIARCIARAIETAAAFVPGPIVLSGHSAGGQLVARVACTDVVISSSVRPRIKRIVPISPVADLRPLLETTMNETLRLDESEADSESPTLRATPDVPVSVWVGAEERPAFLDQAQWLSDAWNASHHIAPGRHHFDIISLLEDPDSALVNDLIDV